jgi:hypothetical protein
MARREVHLHRARAPRGSRRTGTICIGLALATILGIGLPTSPAARAEARTPCLKIKQSCEEAGFKQGAVAEGLGLQVDCIRPIIEGTPQRQGASKPLPSIDAALVAACKAKNPQFGKPKLNDEFGQPTSGSDF